jgi:hypothetical protein
MKLHRGLEISKTIGKRQIGFQESKMAGPYHMGYTGSCQIGSDLFLCTNITPSLEQKISTMDHILGLQDVITTGASTAGGIKKGAASSTAAWSLSNVQKRIYRYSPAIAKISISAPVTEDTVAFQTLLNTAVQGLDIDGGVIATLWNQDAGQVTIDQAKISSFTINMTAGEVPNFTMEVTGASYEFTDGSTGSTADCARLITWDACTVTADPVSSDISSFSITINKPIIPDYKAKWTDDTDASNGLMPQKLRIGMQEVTGSISLYGADVIDAPNSGTVAFSLGDAGASVEAVFYQPKDNVAYGPYMRTISFTGISDGYMWTLSTPSP